MNATMRAEGGLYLDNQQKVIAYARSHHAHMAQCFAELKEDPAGSTIKVDRVFDYLREAFGLDGFQFLDGISGPNVLVQDNIERIQQLLERFYRDFKKIPKEQFYFYRMTITEDEIADLIEFWIKTDSGLFVEYHGGTSGQPTTQSDGQTTKKNPESTPAPQNGTTSDSNNEFIGSEDSVSRMISSLLEQIRLKEAQMQRVTDELERIQLQASINRLREQVQSIEKAAVKKVSTELERKPTEAGSDHNPSVSASAKESAELRRANLHVLFDYYSKQNHITGIKATFDRIEHESNTINYPKLMHLLKDFGLLPEKEKTKIFPLFQKAAADYKTLQLHEFEQLMPQLAHLLISQGSDSEREEKFFQQIFAAEDHHTRLTFKKRAKYQGTGKAFNTRESNDFRIRPEEITYQFQIIPHSGKTADQIQGELVKRRQQKDRYKKELAHQKDIAKQKFLKKLSSIDPFNSNLVGLKSEGKEEHVAGINNLEAFRDISFNPKEFFHISDDNEDDMFMGEYSIQQSTDIKRSQQFEKRSVESSRKAQPAQNTLDSPRRDRANSIVEKVSARASELQKLEKSKNESLLKNILNSQPSASPPRRASLGSVLVSEKSRR